MAQLVEAERWQEVGALCLSAGYLEAKIGLVGLEATEGDLAQAAQLCPDAGLRQQLSEVVRARRKVGTLRTVMAEKDFGFIHIDGDKEIFFHKTELRGVQFTELSIGIEVVFSIGEGPKGRIARGVTISHR